MTYYQILSAINDNGNSIDYVDLLNVGVSDPKRQPLSDKMRIETLISKGYISGKLAVYEQIRLTRSGLELLDTMNEQREQEESQTKAEANKERKQFNLSIASAAIGAALTIVVELAVLLLAKLVV